MVKEKESEVAQSCLTPCGPMDCSLTRLLYPWNFPSKSTRVGCHSKQEYWSGLPIPSPGDLPDPATEPRSPELQADALLSEPPGKLLSISVVT